MALHGAKGEILSRENGPLFRTGAKGERRARRGIAALAVSIKKTSCRVLDRAECFDIMNI